MDERLLQALLQRQNIDGGWGAVPGAASDSECTALSLLALEDAVEAAEAGERWLLQRQEADGAWRFRDEAPIRRWPTPIAMIALKGRSQTAAVERGMDWLLAQRGEQMPWLNRVREFLSGSPSVELDTTLDGWAWAPETFAWVEPTAWALMAIKAVWPQDPPRRARRRIREGEEMLLDRACPGGGWNYGNKRVLGVDLEPYPDTTALALLALIGHSAPEVTAGFAALERLLDEHASGLALSLAALSYQAWGRADQALIDRILARYAEDEFIGETRTLALAAMATASKPGWFGVSAHA